MKSLLLIGACLILGACSSQKNCDSNSGSAIYNGSKVSLINGICTQTTQTVWQNPKYTETTICNQDYTLLGSTVCTSTPDSIGSQTTGCTPMSDGYQVFPNDPSTPTEQCYFEITGGVINSNPTPPSF
jgi:hypothetical protein